jgi:hypothetical protein
MVKKKDKEKQEAKKEAKVSTVLKIVNNFSCNSNV